nr:hypothetical protein [Tanacetum cinerariifolium]
MRRKERVTRNALDAMIQIISLEIVQNHIATMIKRLSLEVLGAIPRMTPKTKPMTKLVSWLNHKMSSISFVVSGSFSITDDGIGGPSYEILLRVVMALASFLGLGMVLLGREIKLEALLL